MYTLGIDIGSTTVKVAVLDKDNKILFSDYKRHFANIKETLKDLVQEAKDALGENEVNPCITGSGGLALAQLIGVPFTQEVVCVSEALQDYAPQTDVAIELGGEDAKIVYFTNGIEQRMNGVCAGGTGSFIDQMATLLQTDASGLNDYAKDYDTSYSPNPDSMSSTAFARASFSSAPSHSTVTSAPHLMHAAMMSITLLALIFLPATSRVTAHENFVISFANTPAGLM